MIEWRKGLLVCLEAYCGALGISLLFCRKSFSILISIYLSISIYTQHSYRYIHSYTHIYVYTHIYIHIQYATLSMGWIKARLKIVLLQGATTYPCNPSSQEVKTATSGVQGEPGLHEDTLIQNSKNKTKIKRNNTN